MRGSARLCTSMVGASAWCRRGAEIRFVEVAARIREILLRLAEFAADLEHVLDAGTIELRAAREAILVARHGLDRGTSGGLRNVGQVFAIDGSRFRLVGGIEQPID